jgi:hypothetical protein
MNSVSVTSTLLSFTSSCHTASWQNLSFGLGMQSRSSLPHLRPQTRTNCRAWGHSLPCTTAARLRRRMPSSPRKQDLARMLFSEFPEIQDLHVTSQLAGVSVVFHPPGSRFCSLVPRFCHVQMASLAQHCPKPVSTSSSEVQLASVAFCQRWLGLLLISLVRRHTREGIKSGILLVKSSRFKSHRLMI